jgi:hypothetical protein
VQEARPVCLSKGASLNLGSPGPLRGSHPSLAQSVVSIKEMK